MRKRLVSVSVRMRLAAVPVRPVPMPVMGIMNVHVLVPQRIVAMPVEVPLRQMQPHTGGHQQPRE